MSGRVFFTSSKSCCILIKECACAALPTVSHHTDMVSLTSSTPPTLSGHGESFNHLAETHQTSNKCELLWDRRPLRCISASMASCCSSLNMAKDSGCSAGTVTRTVCLSLQTLSTLSGTPSATTSTLVSAAGPAILAAGHLFCMTKSVRGSALQSDCMAQSAGR